MLLNFNILGAKLRNSQIICYSKSVTPNVKFSSFYLLLLAKYGGLNLSNFRWRIEKLANYVIWNGNAQCEICLSLRTTLYKVLRFFWSPELRNSQYSKFVMQNVKFASQNS